MKRLLLPLLAALALPNIAPSFSQDWMNNYPYDAKLKAIFCSPPEYFIEDEDEQWEWFPWIFNSKTGALYTYNTQLNQARPLIVDFAGKSQFNYGDEAKIDPFNILRIKEIETRDFLSPNPKIIQNDYTINLNNFEAYSQTTSNGLKQPKVNLKCVEKKLPKNIQICKYLDNDENLC